MSTVINIKIGFLFWVGGIVQRLERSGGGSHQRRTSAISHKLQLNDYCLGGLDSISNASLMEVCISILFIYSFSNDMLTRHFQMLFYFLR